MVHKKEAPNSQLLTRGQKAVLDLVSQEKYLYRLSEDLDLFSEKEIYLPSLRAFVKKVQTKLRLKDVDYNNFLGLHSFQLYFSESEIVKVDFNYYPFPRIEKGVKYKNIAVDSAYDIAVNKVHTIAMKARARDFIDIYFLIKEKGYNLQDLLMQAKAKFDWHIDSIQLGSRLLQASEVADYPRMLRPINHEEWKQFFVREAEKLKTDIFE